MVTPLLVVARSFFFYSGGSDSILPRTELVFGLNVVVLNDYATRSGTCFGELIY